MEPRNSAPTLTSCEINGPGYMTNRERFQSDAATDEALRRKAEIAKKARIIELKREQVTSTYHNYYTS